MQLSRTFLKQIAQPGGSGRGTSVLSEADVEALEARAGAASGYVVPPRPYVPPVEHAGPGPAAPRAALGN